MKILLLGSPEIAVPTFEKVINNFEVVGIVTQPDRPKGRGQNILPTAVANLALKYQIKVFKPTKIRDIKDELANLDFDLLLTFAFGQIIPLEILKMGSYLPLNIHGSLLPKYRGAAPIHHAILNGEREIGITLMEMVQQMDAGDMLFQAKQEINATTSTGEAIKIISNLAQKNIVQWLTMIKENNYHKKAQGSTFTLAPKISKKQGEISSNLTFKEAQRIIYALNPFPGAYIYLKNQRLKIFDLNLEKKPQAIEIKLKDGNFYVYEYQWPSKKRVSIIK